MKLLHKIIKDVSDAMKLPCVAVYARGKKGMNVSLDDEAVRYGNVLMYELLQSPTISITGTLHGYVEYTAVLMFLAVDNGSRDERTRDIIDGQVQTAYEWLTYLRRNANWQAHPDNNSTQLTVQCQETMDTFDAGVSGCIVTLKAKFDPDFNTANICP